MMAGSRARSGCRRDSVNDRLHDGTVRSQKLEVAALVGLRHMLLVERSEGTGVDWCARLPFGAPALELLLTYAHVEASCLDIELNQITSAQKSQRPAYGGLRRHMENAG